MAEKYIYEERTEADTYIYDQIVGIFCKEFQTVWLVRTSDLSMKVFSTDSKRAIPNSVNTALEMNSYDDARKWYVENHVIAYSKERVLRQTDMNNVLKELESGRTYYVEYGRQSKGITNYNQLFYDKIINPITEEIEYVVCGFRNIDIVKRAENDDLTGALTRQTFFRKAEELLAKYPEKSFDIVLSDIVDFKKINETYGVKVGDEILKWHGEYLISLTGPTMIVGRYGGDQMALMGDHESVMTCLSLEYKDRFFKALSDSGLPTITIKYGIYQDVRRDRTIMNTCDKAHIALSSIKSHYSKEIAYYDNKIKLRLEKQRRIEDSMHESLKNGDFKVYYQPKHDAKTGALVGAEALVRWIHPEYGFMNPGDFIPLFEKNGFVVEIDDFVWKTSCKNIRRWNDKGIKTVPISVNASKLSFAQENLVTKMHGHVLENNVLPCDLHVEITETLMEDDIDALIKKLNFMRSEGYKVELDDFGAGFSSMNVLSTLPLDVVKFDMSFMQQFGDKKRLMVLESCIELAKKLGFKTVSEGVEEKEQQQLLGTLGVDMIQGFYYSKPLPEDEFEEYLKNA